MTDKPNLIALAERVEKLEGPCRETDGEIAAALRLGQNLPDWAARWEGEWRPTIQGSVVLMQDDGSPGPHFSSASYTASIDSAMTLCKPHWWVNMSAPLSPDAYGYSCEEHRRPRAGMECLGEPYASGGSGATLPLAVCAMALRAIAEQEGK